MFLNRWEKDMTLMNILMQSFLDIMRKHIMVEENAKQKQINAKRKTEKRKTKTEKQKPKNEKRKTKTEKVNTYFT